jgi:hypothetical protein
LVELKTKIEATNLEELKQEIKEEKIWWKGETSFDYLKLLSKHFERDISEIGFSYQRFKRKYQLERNRDYDKINLEFINYLDQNKPKKKQISKIAIMVNKIKTKFPSGD